LSGEAAGREAGWSELWPIKPQELPRAALAGLGKKPTELLGPALFGIEEMKAQWFSSGSPVDSACGNSYPERGDVPAEATDAMVAVLVFVSGQSASV